jgi:hypothetical protein
MAECVRARAPPHKGATHARAPAFARWGAANRATPVNWNQQQGSVYGNVAVRSRGACVRRGWAVYEWGKLLAGRARVALRKASVWAARTP